MNSEPDSNEDFPLIEKALNSLRPAEPSPALEARVFAIFDEVEGDAGKVVPFPEARGGKVIHWFRPVAAAAAVAAVFLGGVWMFRDRERGGVETAAANPAKNEAHRYQPVSAGNFIENATDEGVVYPDASGQPMRRVRYQYHDTYEWRHPEDGSLIRLSVPQEEFHYLPVETD